MERKRRKRGRPGKPAAERRRHNLTFRVTDELRKQLADWAERDRCSISEEIEAILSEERLTRVLSEGAFGLSDMTRFAEYAALVKAAVTAAGEDERGWVQYACVPFSIVLGDQSAKEAGFEKVRAAVESNYQAAKVRMMAGTAPDPQRSYTAADGPQFDRDMDYRSAELMVRRIEANRLALAEKEGEP